MLGVLLFGLLIAEGLTIEARYTAMAPEIDGILEEIWENADSSSHFIQMAPDEGKPASEKTVVYLLYDDENLYVAFRCFSGDVTAYVGTWDEGEGDGVGVFLDTFGDKRTGYQFRVNARGVQGDAMLYNDGRNSDWNWDGVWFAASKIFPWGYSVEIKIPFKSIRYKKGLTEWGINFSRYINENGEQDYWAPMKRVEEIRISRFGLLKGINPQSHGRFLEIYPVLLGRYDKYFNVKEEARPHLGLDLAWSPSPESYLQITFNPDFGEIEADPYQLNLSKYRLYYRERRPFFIEGGDLFQLFAHSDFNVGPFVRLFYSRNIGRKLSGGEEVPISIGSKFLLKGEKYEGGLLFARTEPRSTEMDSEPLSHYGVGRLKWAFYGNSTIGFLFNAKNQPGKHHVGALAGDLSYRTPIHQLQLVFAESLLDSVWGRFFRGDFSFSGNRWTGVIDALYIGKTFDINEIGFIPLPGQESIAGLIGPHWFPEGGIFRSFYVAVGGGVFKEFDEGVWEKGVVFVINPLFKNRWGFSLIFNYVKSYEVGKHYTSRNFNFNLWSDWTKSLQGGTYCGGSYDYNYNLGFFAWHYWTGGWLNFQALPNLQLSVSSNNPVELNPDGKIEEITFILRPRIEWSLSRSLHLRLYQELVGTRTSGRIERVRFGGLLQFQIAPKSWFYIALNDLEEKDQESMVSVERISLVKIRYLLLF